MFLRALCYTLPLACALTACGGGSDASSPTPTTPTTPTPTTPTTPAPKAEPLQLLVPAYFYPLPGSPWEQLTRSAQAQGPGGVAITAIVNPSNGAGNKAEAPIAQALTAFTQAGGKVLGYIPTGYGKRSAAEVHRHIERYFAFYGRSTFSGFFLDEMSASSAQLAYYQGLHQDIKALDPQLLVVGNPGAIPSADYANVADTLVSFEGPAANYQNFLPQGDKTWVYQYSNRKQAMLVHDAASCTAMQAALTAAASRAHHMGAVYVTHRHFDYASKTGNPWAGLPTYWEPLLASVGALNQGHSLPNCPAE